MPARQNDVSTQSMPLIDLAMHPPDDLDVHFSKPWAPKDRVRCTDYLELSLADTSSDLVTNYL
jgi:hypothetical protein